MDQSSSGTEIAGRYRIIGTLGRGGLSTVYRAVDIRLNRVVAIKALHLNDPHFLERFRREANLLASLKHPGIVTYLDYFEAGDSSYLVMEYVDGQSLAQILSERKTLDVDFAIAIIRQVGEALGYGHQQGLIHRDIKPSNIIIASDGRAKLLDWGIAIAQRTSPLTEIGTVSGTPSFMSPEQVQGHRIDARSDIYALATVLYQMLTGKLPFSGDTPLVILHRVVTQPPIPLRQVRPDIPPSLEKVILKALSKDPNQRFQSMREFVAALDSSFRTSYSIQKEYTPLRASPSSRISLTLLMGTLAGLGVIALTLGILGFYFALNYVPGTPTRIAILTPPVSSTITPAITGTPTVTATAPTPTQFLPTPTPGPVAPWILPDASNLAPFVFVLVIAIGFLLLFGILMRRTSPRHAPLVATTALATGETLPYRPPPMTSTMVIREPSAMAWLLGLTGTQRGRKFELADNAAIGRDGQCDIVIDDPTLSKMHARIRLEGRQFYLYDLASTNGTYVNGVRISKHMLQDRDEIRLGNRTFLFVQAVGPDDLTVEAKRRVREFDAMWDELTKAVRNDD